VQTTTADGTTLYYETTGEGETVAFVGEAGYGAWQWSWQYARLAGPREALVWDLRGTGRSDCPPGPYDVDRLAADFEAVLADSGTERGHVVGAGLGGMVALRYAREYGRARTLTLFGVPPAGGEVRESELRALHAPPDDPAALRDSLAVALSPEFRTRQPDTLDRICEWRREEDATVEGFTAQVEAVTSFAAGPLHELTVPALVCHGIDDSIVPLQAGKRLGTGLPNGTFEAVEGRHLCFVEQARPVTDRLFAFLDEHATDRDRRA
jgi:3-oxoadipate enol-lactonase